MESQIKVTSATTIQHVTLTQELQILMNEVEKLREETKSIICNCNDPCCPFSVKGYEEKYQNCAEFKKERKSPDFGFGNMETIHHRKYKIAKRFSLPSAVQLQLSSPQHKGHSNSTSLTNIPTGVHRRTDGTIVETDYPGFCSSGKSKNKRSMESISILHLNHLDVQVSPLDDCKVDQDGAVSTNKDYRFRREAPERKIVRSPYNNACKSYTLS